MIKRLRKVLFFILDKTIYRDRDRIEDYRYLKYIYYKATGEKLNLDNPRTFNDKINWLKINDRKPIYTVMADKYGVRKLISEMWGEEYLIPLLGVWSDSNQIEFDKLPDKFVLKCTHDSESVIICRDKSKFDFDGAKRKLAECLETDYFQYSREWAYKDIPHRIIAEEYMEDCSGHELKDYKFYCFNGEPKFLYVSEGLENHDTARISFITTDWQFAKFGRSDFVPLKRLPIKPLNYEKMLDMAREASKGMRFLRVDLYEINGRVYFGEFTLYPSSGIMPFVPKEWNKILGDWLRID